jgi:hypothetical protein
MSLSTLRARILLLLGLQRIFSGGWKEKGCKRRAGRMVWVWGRDWRWFWRRLLQVVAVKGCGRMRGDCLEAVQANSSSSSSSKEKMSRQNRTSSSCSSSSRQMQRGKL